MGQDRISFRLLFLTVNINFVVIQPNVPLNTTVHRDASENLPTLRLRGGGIPLRLRGGGPPKGSKQAPKLQVPDAALLCKDLMDDYDKLMADYKKSLGPCGTATCPMNYNVVEDKCKAVCGVTCPEPYCPPPPGPCTKPICPHLNAFSQAEDEAEENPDDFKKLQECFASCVANQADGKPAVPCGRTVCPFTSLPPDLCPPKECPELEECNVETCIAKSESLGRAPCPPKNPLKDKIKCNKHICPYEKEKLTIDDVNPFNRKIDPRKGCGSPFCPHSNKYQVDPDIIIPAFTCKQPCPSLEDLPPIHWDCPDPLPQGECTNPFCPLREKLPCGHCPIDPRHCGMPGCQFAGDSLCPPTCPYTQKKPPTDLECTPSICPLMRPDDYISPSYVPRKERPCKDQCPYAVGKKSKSCGNPNCPFKTCIDNLAAGKHEDCGNPCCPYKETARKRAEQEKQRTAVKAAQEATFSPVKPDSSKDTQPSKPPPGGRASEASRKLRTSIAKSMASSIAYLQSAAQGPDPARSDACTEISCAEFQGDRLCKKCIAENRAKEAAGDKQAIVATKKKNMAKKPKKKKNRGYVYDKGTYYPGIKFGHHDCDHTPRRVPWDMGWRWNIHNSEEHLKSRPGWRPGAIGKTMLKFINAERKKIGLPPRHMLKDPLPRKLSSKGSGLNAPARANRHKAGASVTHLRKPKPTLTVKKKDGVIYVTMNPLKDPARMEDNEYPYIDCSPLEFKITKNKLNNCLCNANDPDGNVDSEESSDLDIEFTPPAGIVRGTAKNKHICHTESQYNQADIPKAGGGKKGKKDKGKKGKKGGKGKGKKKKK